jgi:hypothetical protein
MSNLPHDRAGDPQREANRHMCSPETRLPSGSGVRPHSVAQAWRELAVRIAVFGVACSFASGTPSVSATSMSAVGDEPPALIAASLSDVLPRESEPPTTEPLVSEPTGTEPSDTEPPESVPSTSAPTDTEPSASGPASTEDDDDEATVFIWIGTILAVALVGLAAWWMLRHGGDRDVVPPDEDWPDHSEVI